MTHKEKKINTETILKLKTEKYKFVPARTTTLPKGKVDDILDGRA